MNTKELEEIIKQQEESEVPDDIVLLSELARQKKDSVSSERYTTGIPVIDGVAKLDPVTDRGGLAGGEIVIIAAPTGHGKTTMSQTLSYNMLKNEGMASLWFTYEVSEYALWRKFELMGAKPEDFICVPANNTTGNVAWLDKKIKEAKTKYLIGVVVIDHLGFLAPAQDMNKNMSQNYSSYLAQIVRELKQISVRENVVIILPVHMNKSTDQDPTLRDIGYSGGIAQEADFVILMARLEDREGSSYYKPETKCFLAKNRPGGETPKWYMKIEGGKFVEAFGVVENKSSRF